MCGGIGGGCNICGISLTINGYKNTGESQIIFTVTKPEVSLLMHYEMSARQRTDGFAACKTQGFGFLVINQLNAQNLVL